MNSMCLVEVALGVADFSSRRSASLVPQRASEGALLLNTSTEPRLSGRLLSSGRRAHF